MSELLTTFGVNWKLLFIQAVNFGVLLVLLTSFLYRPILRIIDERREKVAEGVRTAEEASRKLDDAKTESEGLIGQAARDAEALVSVARTRAEGTGTDIVKAAEVKASGLIKEAEMRSEEAKRQALQESEKEIARAAVLAAEKILKGKSA